MGVGRVLRAHLCDSVCEQALADEDVRIFREKAENEPRHEVIHVVAARGRAPFGIVFQKFDIKPVQAAGGADVERVFGDLPNGGDARKRQEESEMVRKILVSAGDGFAASQILGFKVCAVGRQNEFGFAFAVAGLSLSAVRVFVTSPAPHVGYEYCWSGERRQGRTCSMRPRAAS